MTIVSTQISPPAGATAPHNGFSLISNEKLLQLYSAMLKCRMLEKRVLEKRIIEARALALSERNGSTKLGAAISQEAAAVGVGLGLLPGDTLAPSHHGFIQSFVKGLPLERIFSSLSAARAPYASLNLISPSFRLAIQLDRALESAAINKKSRNKKIAVAFCGSASAAPDLLHSAMRQAGKRKLPILLVCHNDTETDELGQQAQDCGLPGVTVDGDDAVAVYRVATEAMAHARRGSGPTLIECKPWPHAASPGKRRKAADPILNMETYLTRKGLFDKKMKSAVTAAFRRELDAVVKANGPQRAGRP